MARSKDIDVSTEGISSTRSSAYDTFDEALRANLSQMTMSIEALNATWEGPNHQNFVSTYEEHKDDYALPDRVGVRYATLSATNFISSVVIDDADIDDYYDSNPSLYSRQGTNGVEAIPLDEVRDSIYRELAMQEAVNVAVTNLNDFIESLATNDLETFTWRCQARGMKTADTALFALNASFLPGVEREALEEFRAMSLFLQS